MAQLQEAVETYTYVISGLSGETQMSYCDKIAVFAEFCARRDIHTPEDLTPKVFTQFILKCHRYKGEIPWTSRTNSFRKKPSNRAASARR